MSISASAQPDLTRVTNHSHRQSKTAKIPSPSTASKSQGFPRVPHPHPKESQKSTRDDRQRTSHASNEICFTNNSLEDSCFAESTAGYLVSRSNNNMPLITGARQQPLEKQGAGFKDPGASRTTEIQQNASVSTRPMVLQRQAPPERSFLEESSLVLDAEVVESDSEKKPTGKRKEKHAGVAILAVPVETGAETPEIAIDASDSETKAADKREESRVGIALHTGSPVETGAETPEIAIDASDSETKAADKREENRVGIAIAMNTGSPVETGPEALEIAIDASDSEMNAADKREENHVGVTVHATLLETDAETPKIAIDASDSDVDERQGHLNVGAAHLTALENSKMGSRPTGNHQENLGASSTKRNHDYRQPSPEIGFSDSDFEDERPKPTKKVLEPPFNPEVMSSLSVGAEISFAPGEAQNDEERLVTDAADQLESEREREVSSGEVNEELESSTGEME